MFSPPVPDLNDHGDVLVGGRADVILRTRVAALVYRHGNHVVNVFIWPADAAPLRPLRGDIDGFHILGGTVEGFRIALVSDLNPEELAAFRDRWAAAANQAAH